MKRTTATSGATRWPWCLDSGMPPEGGHPAFRPEKLPSGRYRCSSCGREVAACHPGGGGEWRLARHMKPAALAPASRPSRPDG